METNTKTTSRRWCFTVNNWSQEELDTLLALQVIYLIIGKEVGENNTPHLQGFVILPKPQRLSALKKINLRAHWEPARGTTEQASDYCKKDGDFTETGTRPETAAEAGGQSNKRRFEDAFDAAKRGDFDSIPADIKWRYYRTCKEIAKDYMPKPDDAEDTTGVWIYGGPGVGKSRKAREDYPDAYFKMQNKWWDGYQGEAYVILDDFDSKELGHHLKIWADRYSFLAETKGGATHIRPQKIIITSNYSPDDIKFDWDQEMRDAIKRRFKIIHMIQRLPPSC